MMSLKKCNPFFIFLLLFSIFVGYGYLKKYIKAEGRRKNHAETTAVVNEFYSIRYTYYYRYSFNVNGKIYEGSEHRNPNSVDILIGDTIVIEYDSLNPSNNKPIQLPDNSDGFQITAGAVGDDEKGIDVDTLKDGVKTQAHSSKDSNKMNLPLPN